VARSRAVGADMEQIRKDLSYSLHKLNLINDKK